MKENERTLQMKKNFMRHWREGKTVYEIAKLYKLSPTTVYAKLEAIASSNGVTRESLLKAPHSEHLTYDRQYEPVSPINIDEFKNHCKNALAALDQTCKQIYEECKGEKNEYYFA